MAVAHAKAAEYGRGAVVIAGLGKESLVVAV